MTSDAFAALERRLTPVLSEGGRGHVDRHDVLDLLAECRRLRRPPDVSGLMPAGELAGVRTWTSLGGKWLRLLFAHIDAQAALIRELYGVVGDLHADDPGRQALLERGRAEGREQAARQVEGFVEANVNPPVHPGIVPSIRALGPCRPPLPPSEAEREAGRLREALRGLVAAAGRVSASLGPATGAWFDGLVGAYDAARAALGEDAR